MSMYVSAASWSLMPNSFCTCTPNPQHINKNNNCSSVKLPTLLNHALNTCLATDMYFQGQCFSTVELS